MKVQIGNVNKTVFTNNLLKLHSVFIAKVLTPQQERKKK